MADFHTLLAICNRPIAGHVELDSPNDSVDLDVLAESAGLDKPHSSRGGRAKPEGDSCSSAGLPAQHPAQENAATPTSVLVVALSDHTQHSAEADVVCANMQTGHVPSTFTAPRRAANIRARNRRNQQKHRERIRVRSFALWAVVYQVDCCLPRVRCE